MKKTLFIFLASFCIPTIAEDCGCKIYPFEPNPPCYKKCIKYLVENKNVKLTDIENIEPSVAVSIFALRKKERDSIVNLDSITNQKELQLEAIKVIPAQGEWRL